MNTVFLTRIRHTGVKLVVLTFLFGYLDYFSDFINLSCLVIATLQLYYNEYRSIVPLLLFSSMYSLYNLVMLWDIIKEQDRINRLTDICVGDHIMFDHQADKDIPCDMVLVGGSNIVVNELELTGENNCTLKFVGDVLFRGTQLVDGHGSAKAIRVGNDCSLYNTKTRERRYDTTLYKECLRFTRICIAILIGISIFISWLENVNLVRLILLLNTIVPLSLQTFYNSATVIFSWIISKKANVKVNKHGIYFFHENVDYIVTDKTGTLTCNDLMLKDVVYFNKRNSLKHNLSCVTNCKYHSKTGELLKTDELEYLLAKSCGISNIEKLFYRDFNHDIGVKLSVVMPDKLELHIQGIPEIVNLYCNNKFDIKLENRDNHCYNRVIAHSCKYITREEFDIIKSGKFETILCDFDCMSLYVFSDRIPVDLHKTMKDIKHVSIITGDSLESSISRCKSSKDI